MKRKITKLLCCPKCGSGLRLRVFSTRGEEIIEGLFTCKKCFKKYYIFEGIPRFVKNSDLLMLKSFEKYLKKYKISIPEINDNVNQSNLENIKSNTFKYFGYEWKYFNDWGWLSRKQIPKREHYKYQGGFTDDRHSAFVSKCLMSDSDISKGKIVLDAGCGNGRYTYEAAKVGAEVVGVDMGYGVESAYQHMKQMENVHIVQADLFMPPFKNNIFDSVFSNGVLMHTGNARKAFNSICKKVKKGGVFTAHLYHKLNLLWEFNDYLLRLITVRLSVERSMNFANFMSKFGQLSVKMKLSGIVNFFLRLQPSLIHMYDWYSAPIATHHTYAEVEEWFQDRGFEVIKTKRESLKHYPLIKPWALTVKGKKK